MGGSMISSVDFSLYKVCDSVDATVDEIMHFYRVFHSMRFVRKQLVFRLQRHLPEAVVRQINADFTDLLAKGEFVQREALKEEADEFRLAELPRLAFHFNRRNYGRLRQVIDLINASDLPAKEASATPER
jgi:hypothetical protein